MDKFEKQFEDLDVQTNTMDEAMSSTTATSIPQDQVDQLLKQMAEEANIELEHDLASKDVQKLPDVAAKERSVVGEEDTQLAERLRALRPAT
jgi:charged multivesicular body protein 1